jgi:hypothetical protein
LSVGMVVLLGRSRICPGPGCGYSM